MNDGVLELEDGHIADDWVSTAADDPRVILPV